MPFRIYETEIGAANVIAAVARLLEECQCTAEILRNALPALVSEAESAAGRQFASVTRLLKECQCAPDVTLDTVPHLVHQPELAAACGMALGALCRAVAQIGGLAEMSRRQSRGGSCRGTRPQRAAGGS